MRLILSHKATQSSIDVEASSSIASLRDRIHSITLVPPQHQKLLPKPAKGVSLGTARKDDDDQKTIEEAGLKDDMTLMILGATVEQVDQIRGEEQEASKWKQPREYHPSLVRGTKPRSTATAQVANSFHSLAPHASLSSSSPLYPKVMAYLTRLAEDPGVVHVCRLHSYTVGHMTELLPWESPKLLGLNENRGQTIRLRLRTDDAEGFRDYKTTRAILLHELAHNDIGDHPPEFKILNSKLNAELAAFEKAQEQGRHSLHEGEVYVPEVKSAGGGAYRLGGGGGEARADADSPAERRQAVLQATLKRLEKLEAEIEVGCGSGSSNAGSKK